MSVLVRLHHTEMTTDDLAPQPEPTLFGFIKNKLPVCLGGSCQQTEQPGLLSQQILSTDRISGLAQESFTKQQLSPYDTTSRTTSRTTTNNPTLYTELEFFKSNDPTGQTPAVFDVITGGTQSLTGREYLRKITSRPTTDLELLLCRQHTTNFMVQPQHTAEIHNVLQNFKANEPAMYWLLDKKTPEMREVLDIIFFSKSWSRSLNKNTGFITAYFYFIMIFNPLWGLSGPLILLLIPFLVSRYLMKVPIPFTTYLETLKSTLFGDKFFGMLIMGRQIFNTLSGGGGISGGDDSTQPPSTRLRNALINKAFDLITSEFGRWLYLGIVIGGYLWSVYNQLVVSYNFNKLINFIHDRMNKFRQVLDGAKSIIRLCDRADQTGLRCPEFSQLAADCIQLLNTNPVVQLIATDPVFLSSPGFFTNKGAIIKAFYMLELETTPPASQTVIRPFIRLLGYIDGWHAVSVIQKTNNLAVAQYDMASTQPILHLSEEFSPVCMECVPNSVELGTGDTAPSPNNILLTGPNGSGKSTFLKSVMTNIVLAQTLGIAFAREIRITPFQYLSTYLNIPDCQGRESLFQAEMSRCHQHLEQLRELENKPERTGFSFNIMDEIFVSTNYLEGMSGAYAVIKHLGTLENSCHIITTHFDKLVSSDGAQTSIPGYANKYFKIDMLGDLADENAEIRKDYILRDGVNDKHLALHLLKLRGFDTELVRDAKDMYARLTEPVALTSHEPTPVTESTPVTEQEATPVTEQEPESEKGQETENMENIKNIENINNVSKLANDSEIHDIISQIAVTVPEDNTTPPSVALETQNKLNVTN